MELGPESGGVRTLEVGESGELFVFGVHSGLSHTVNGTRTKQKQKKRVREIPRDTREKRYSLVMSSGGVNNNKRTLAS